MVAENFFSGRILNNAHRGDVVEIIVQSALGADWKFVGLGWHPWDLQRGRTPGIATRLYVAAVPHEAQQRVPVPC